MWIWVCLLMINKMQGTSSIALDVVTTGQICLVPDIILVERKVI